MSREMILKIKYTHTKLHTQRQHMNFNPVSPINNQLEERGIIRAALGLDPKDDNLWTIADSLDVPAMTVVRQGERRPGERSRPYRLRMLNYDKFNLDAVRRLGHLRGIILDLDAFTTGQGSEGGNEGASQGSEGGKVVCLSLGSNPLVVSDDLHVRVGLDAFGRVQSVLETCDVDGTRLNITNGNMFRGEEGMVIRTFKYRGTVYFSTYKNIQARYTTWKGVSLENLWLDAGGMPVNEMWPSEGGHSALDAGGTDAGGGHSDAQATSLDSSVTQFWMLSHRLMWLCNKWKSTSTVSLICTVPSGRSGHSAEYGTLQTPLDYAEALNHLRHGGTGGGTGTSGGTSGVAKSKFCGEFLLIIYPGPQNDLRMIRIESESYNFRQTLAAQNPDLEKQLYLLGDYSGRRSSEFKELFPRLTDFSNEYFEDLVDGTVTTTTGLYVYPGTIDVFPDFEIVPRDTMIRQIHLSYLMSVSPHLQKAVLGYIQNYDNFKALVVHKIADKTTVIPNHLARRVDQIRQAAIHGMNGDLTELINKEFGDSLFKLVVWARGDDLTTIR